MKELQRSTLMTCAQAGGIRHQTRPKRQALIGMRRQTLPGRLYLAA